MCACTTSSWASAQLKMSTCTTNKHPVATHWCNKQCTLARRTTCARTLPHRYSQCVPATHTGATSKSEQRNEWVCAGPIMVCPGATSDACSAVPWCNERCVPVQLTIPLGAALLRNEWRALEQHSGVAWPALGPVLGSRASAYGMVLLVPQSAPMQQSSNFESTL